MTIPGYLNQMVSDSKLCDMITDSKICEELQYEVSSCQSAYETVFSDENVIDTVYHYVGPNTFFHHFDKSADRSNQYLRKKRFEEKKLEERKKVKFMGDKINGNGGEVEANLRAQLSKTVELLHREKNFRLVERGKLVSQIDGMKEELLRAKKNKSGEYNAFQKENYNLKKNKSGEYNAFQKENYNLKMKIDVLQSHKRVTSELISDIDKKSDAMNKVLVETREQLMITEAELHVNECLTKDACTILKKDYEEKKDCINELLSASVIDGEKVRKEHQEEVLNLKKNISDFEKEQDTFQNLLKEKDNYEVELKENKKELIRNQSFYGTELKEKETRLVAQREILREIKNQHDKEMSTRLILLVADIQQKEKLLSELNEENILFQKEKKAWHETLKETKTDLEDRLSTSQKVFCAKLNEKEELISAVNCQNLFLLQRNEMQKEHLIEFEEERNTSRKLLVAELKEKENLLSAVNHEMIVFQEKNIMLKEDIKQVKDEYEERNNVIKELHKTELKENETILSGVTHENILFEESLRDIKLELEQTKEKLFNLKQCGKENLILQEKVHSFNQENMILKEHVSNLVEELNSSTLVLVASLNEKENNMSVFKKENNTLKKGIEKSKLNFETELRAIKHLNKAECDRKEILLGQNALTLQKLEFVENNLAELEKERNVNEMLFMAELKGKEKLLSTANCEKNSNREEKNILEEKLQKVECEYEKELNVYETKLKENEKLKLVAKMENLISKDNLQDAVSKHEKFCRRHESEMKEKENLLSERNNENNCLREENEKLMQNMSKLCFDQENVQNENQQLLEIQLKEKDHLLSIANNQNDASIKEKKFLKEYILELDEELITKEKLFVVTTIENASYLELLKEKSRKHEIELAEELYRSNNLLSETNDENMILQEQIKMQKDYVNLIKSDLEDFKEKNLHEMTSEKLGKEIDMKQQKKKMKNDWWLSKLENHLNNTSQKLCEDSFKEKENVLSAANRSYYASPEMNKMQESNNTKESQSYTKKLENRGTVEIKQIEQLEEELIISQKLLMFEFNDKENIISQRNKDLLAHRQLNQTQKDKLKKAENKLTQELLLRSELTNKILLSGF